jgi:hypothetical protein
VRGEGLSELSSFYPELCIVYLEFSKNAMMPSGDVNIRVGTLQAVRKDLPSESGSLEAQIN